MTASATEDVSLRARLVSSSVQVDLPNERPTQWKQLRDAWDVASSSARRSSLTVCVVIGIAIAVAVAAVTVGFCVKTQHAEAGGQSLNTSNATLVPDVEPEVQDLNNLHVALVPDVLFNEIQIRLIPESPLWYNDSGSYEIREAVKDVKVTLGTLQSHLQDWWAYSDAVEKGHVFECRRQAYSRISDAKDKLKRYGGTWKDSIWSRTAIVVVENYRSCIGHPFSMSIAIAMQCADMIDEVDKRFTQINGTLKASLDDFHQKFDREMDPPWPAKKPGAEEEKVLRRYEQYAQELKNWMEQFNNALPFWQSIRTLVLDAGKDRLQVGQGFDRLHALIELPRSIENPYHRDWFWLLFEVGLRTMDIHLDITSKPDEDVSASSAGPKDEDSNGSGHD